MKNLMQTQVTSHLNDNTFGRKTYGQHGHLSQKTLGLVTAGQLGDKFFRQTSCCPNDATPKYASISLLVAYAVSTIKCIVVILIKTVKI